MHDAHGPSLVDSLVAIVEHFVRGVTHSALFFWPLPERVGVWPAIVSAAAIATALFVVRARRSGERPSLAGLGRFLLPREVWLHPSALLDYRYVALNGGIKFLFVFPVLVPAVWFADRVAFGLDAVLGVPTSSTLSPATVALLYTVAAMLVSDFLYYVQHWLLHHVPMLWEFHKVHHSAEVLTPFTARREHPLEALFNLQRRLLAFGLVTGVFRHLFPGELGLWTIFGVNAGRYLFFTLAAHLRHSHVWLSWGAPLEHLLLSPAQHQIHHSAAFEHRDRNLGSQFALWDWAFGSLTLAGPPRTLELGTGNAEDLGRYQTVRQLYWTPVRAVADRFRSSGSSSTGDAVRKVARRSA